MTEPFNFKESVFYKTADTTKKTKWYKVDFTKDNILEHEKILLKDKFYYKGKDSDKERYLTLTHQKLYCQKTQNTKQACMVNLNFCLLHYYSEENTVKKSEKIYFIKIIKKEKMNIFHTKDKEKWENWINTITYNLST